jgi:hypothetical protein
MNMAELDRAVADWAARRNAAFMVDWQAATGTRTRLRRLYPAFDA